MKYKRLLLFVKQCISGRPEPVGRIKRVPGSALKRFVQESAAFLLLGSGAVLGLLAGYWLCLAGVPWGATFLVAVSALVMLIAYQNNAERWYTGYMAERRVGSAIEYALTSPGAALAHSVTHLSGSRSDMDHVVLTHKAIWVIDTKRSWLRRTAFPKALWAVARQAEEVRQYLDREGCRHTLQIKPAIVLDEGDPRRPSYREKGWTVHVLTREKLTKALREEMTGDEGRNKALAKAIWKLNRDPSKTP